MNQINTALENEIAAAVAKINADKLDYVELSNGQAVEEDGFNGIWLCAIGFGPTSERRIRRIADGWTIINAAQRERFASTVARMVGEAVAANPEIIATVAAPGEVIYPATGPSAPATVDAIAMMDIALEQATGIDVGAVMRVEEVDGHTCFVIANEMIPGMLDIKLRADSTDQASLNAAWVGFVDQSIVEMGL